jgi:two-component system, OmpR family, KDP operon response regulator KdpE
MSAKSVVLVVDDDPAILRLNKLELSGQGFSVLSAENGDEALALAEQHRPDIVVLDIMMPNVNGLEVMRRLRERANVPIILLSGKNHDDDIVSGLELGADDYLAKPFNPEELSARVRAVLRRQARPADNIGSIVRAGDVEIDLERRLVFKAGEPVSLTRTEWLLLQSFAANAGKVMLNSELLTRVWGPEYVNDLQYLRVWVSRLRAKLEPDQSNPTIIKTRPGLGYVMETKAPEAVPAQ